jgi:hypothetical protein
VGVAGVSEVALLELIDCESGSFLRMEGEGETCRELLRFRSRSRGFSLYAVGGRWGLRDWYLCSLGGTAGLSGGEGVGLREDSWVMVGETAAKRERISTTCHHRESCWARVLDGRMKHLVLSSIEGRLM